MKEGRPWWRNCTRTYKQDVYGYLLSLTRDPSLAEDLLSETFLKAIQSLPKFRGDSTSKTWLLGIARNVYGSRSCAAAVRRWSTATFGGVCRGGMIDHFLTREAVARVGNCSGKRKSEPDGWWPCGWTAPYQEIARELGITENSARVIDFRTKNG